MPPSITIGTITAAIIQFVIVMALIQPAVSLVTPKNFTNTYYGNSTKPGVVNGTYSGFNSLVAMPIASDSQTSSGFNAINILASGNGGNFGGLAFIYGALPQFASHILNAPGLIYNVFTGSFAYLPASLGIAVAGLISIGIVAYISLILLYKVITQITKTSIEET